MDRRNTTNKGFYLECLKVEVPIFLLLGVTLTFGGNFYPKLIAPSITITVNRSSPVITSQYASGLSLIDNSLLFPWGTNNLTAVTKVKASIKKATRFIDTPTMAWGLADPWPDPSQAEPANWSSLDSRLHLIKAVGAVPVITLNEAPWWIKGQLQPDGTTRLLQQSEEWSDIAYSSRILDNKMDVWLHLVQRIAERYMVAPYNVRYFQVWNELKGYYNPLTNTYDYTTSAGDPSGFNAKHGYTYMYNLVYAKLMQVAKSLGIAEESIKVGGPYPVMDTWSSAQQSNPSRVSKKYGIFDQRPLNVIQYWLQHKVGAGFITVDGSNNNKDKINLTDPFTASEKLADVNKWIRSLNNTMYPGAATLPIWWAEWYVAPYSDTADSNYNNAIKSYTMIEFIKAGGAVPFLWGGLGEGTSSTGLWTPPTRGGGKPLPWYYSFKAFNTFFGAGTKIYKTIVSMPNSVAVLASYTKIMLDNKTASTLIVSVNGKIVSLHPYQVKVISF